ncbi:hypothetical protein LIA77_03808 [Sarocladium implicatum]|nr:hypothetical protein LIA77_03808 [Sarocladium implicatum]
MEIDDTDADALAMAQAMGFSSFGDQHPSKKRRYNPQSDASLPFAGANGHKPNPASASGANSAPLGTPRASAPAPAATALNTDEISLEEDDQADQDAGSPKPPTAAIASLPARPAVSAPGAGLGSSSQDQRQQHHHPRGQHNPLWYQGYYDPSSNANPWQRLEKKLDLSPRDTWPELSQQQQQPNHAMPAAATPASSMNT